MDDVDIRHGTSVRLEQHVCPRAVHDWVIAKQPSCIRYHTHIILIIPYQTVSYHTILYHPISYLSYHIFMLYPTLPYPYHTLPYNTQMRDCQAVPASHHQPLHHHHYHHQHLHPSVHTWSINTPIHLPKSFSNKYFPIHQLCPQYHEQVEKCREVWDLWTLWVRQRDNRWQRAFCQKD